MDNIEHISFNVGVPVTSSASTIPPPHHPPSQRKRGIQEIKDDEDVMVIELSAEEITTKKVFLCELCHKDFTREQNLLVHQRAHDLRYDRKNYSIKNKDEGKRKVYLCPETTCANHSRLNALCHLTSLKKHYQRKHCEKTMRCSKCSKLYAVKGDLLAHERICGTKDYQCECGSRFSRMYNFATHKISCNEAMAQHLFSIQNDLQTSKTTTENNSISFFNKQSILSSSNGTSVQSFPFSSDTMVAPPIPNISSLDRFVHMNVTTTYPANNTSIQGSELSVDTFDAHVLHDTLFSVSSVPSPALLRTGPQQGITWSDLEGAPTSFLESLENSHNNYSDHNVFSAYPNFSNMPGGNSHFPALENLSGTYENPNISINQGNNMDLNFQGDYMGNTMNEKIFTASVEDKATQNVGLYGFSIDQTNQNMNMQNGGLSGFDIDQINPNEDTQNGGPSGFGNDQIIQNGQFSSNKSVGGDANLSVFQNNFDLWENWG